MLLPHFHYLPGSLSENKSRNLVYGERLQEADKSSGVVVRRRGLSYLPLLFSQKQSQRKKPLIFNSGTFTDLERCFAKLTLLYIYQYAIIKYIKYITQ